MTIKESAAEIYDTLQALHDAVGDTPEMIAHHGALNTLRQLLGMTWEEFLAFIEREEPQARSGGSNKDAPPPPPPGPK